MTSVVIRNHPNSVGCLCYISTCFGGDDWMNSENGTKILLFSANRWLYDISTPDPSFLSVTFFPLTSLTCDPNAPCHWLVFSGSPTVWAQIVKQLFEPSLLPAHSGLNQSTWYVRPRPNNS